MRSLALRVLALGLGLAAALALSEGLVRGLERVRDRGDLRGLHVARPDRPWLYGLRPGADVRLPESGDVSYQINEQGFRDASRPLEKPEGAFRILALGDSVTFGYRVAREDAYPSRLGALLQRENGGSRIEVLNFGVGGYNAYNEVALLSDRGPDYDPDLVLVQFCINDLNDPTLHFDRQTRLVLGRLPDAAFPNPAERLAPGGSRGGGLGLCLRLRSCALVYERLAGLTALRTSPAAFEGTFAPRDGPAHETEWDWLRERYREMARAASRAGARLVVVAFPFEAQLTDPRRRFAPLRLAAMGREGGWPTIDLLPAFAERARSERLLFDAWHPSAAGHRVAAQEIARELRCRGLVPTPPPSDCVPGG